MEIVQHQPRRVCISDASIVGRFIEFGGAMIEDLWELEVICGKSIYEDRSLENVCSCPNCQQEREDVPAPELPD